MLYAFQFLEEEGEWEGPLSQPPSGHTHVTTFIQIYK